MYITDLSILTAPNLFSIPSKSQLLPISPHPSFVSFCSQFGFKPTGFNQRHIHGPDLKLIPGPWAAHNDYIVEDNDFPFFSTLDCL